MKTRGTSLAWALTLLLIFCACRQTPQQRRDVYLQKGKQFLEKKDYQRALLQFQNAAKLAPKEAEPQYQVGVAALAARDVQTAVTAFRRALDRDPHHLGARLAMAQLMTASGDPGLLKEAETQFDELLRTFPANTVMLNSLALTQLKLGKTDEAIERLQELLDNSPQQLQSSVLLAQAKMAKRDVKGAEEVLRKACASAPRDAAARAMLGKFYLAQNKAAEAEAEFQRALQLDSRNWGALMDLAAVENATGRKAQAEEKLKTLARDGGVEYRPVHALFLLRENRRDEALSEFEAIAKRFPDDRQARTWLVKAYQMLNRTADAEKVLAAALKNNGKDLDALLQRGELLIGAGKYAEAENDLNAVLRLLPESADVHFMLARLYRLQGATLRYRGQAYEALKLNPYLLPARLDLAASLTAGNAPQAALDLLNQTPASQRQMIGIVIQRNWALWSLGDLAEMRKGIDAGLARLRAPDFLIQDGLWKLRSGNPAGARAALEEALKMNPSDIRALDGLRQSYLAQQQPTLALEKVKEFASKQPQSAAVQQFLGTLLIANGQKDEARKAFTIAKVVEPQMLAADLSLVQLAVLDRKWDDAKKRLKDVVTANPTNTLAQLWLGNVELIQGNRNAAIDHFRKVVDADPSNPPALNNLAYLLSSDASRVDEALKYAEKARERSPNDADIADTLGWTYYQKRLYPLAVQHLETAAAKGNAVVKYHLAMAYLKSGDVARGKATFDAAQKLNPNLAEAAEAKRLLDQAR